MDNNQNNQTLGFELLGSVPTEIWTLIFEAVVNAYDPAFLVIDLEEEESGDLHLTSSEGRVPPILHVNHLARTIALRSYQLLFGSVDGRPQFFSVERDALHLNANIFGYSVWADWIQDHPGTEEDLAQVQNLAIYCDSAYDRAHLPVRLMHLLSFPSLRHLQHGEWTSRPGRAERWRESLESWWEQVIQPMQAQAGREVTPPPSLTFLTRDKVQRLLRLFWSTLGDRRRT